MSEQNRVVLEIAAKKSFASALDWPGWCRPGKTAEESLVVLADYAPRYQVIAELAGLGGIHEIAEHLDVIEKLEGDPTTEFGAPNIHAAAEDLFMTPEECERQLALLQACWTFFDDVSARVSEEMQKGPRGGGRNRTEIINHVNEAQRYYVTQLGVKAKRDSLVTRELIEPHREAIIAALREHNQNQQHPRWPLRYVIRRAAWHVLDHSWEMEDKDLTSQGAQE
ncbi:MAG: hypothetical protein KC435_00020 [Thermomicrobiales bacterium]|nr:hypothetical protein [Thermomicrobiales bacterium]